MAGDRRQGWGKEDEKGTVSRRWGQGLGREPESWWEQWGPVSRAFQALHIQCGL